MEVVVEQSNLATLAAKAKQARVAYSDAIADLYDATETAIESGEVEHDKHVPLRQQLQTLHDGRRVLFGRHRDAFNGVVNVLGQTPPYALQGSGA